MSKLYILTPDWPALMGMLDRATMFLVRPRLISKVALRAGSSKQGKAFLADVGSKCVVAIVIFFPPSSV